MAFEAVLQIKAAEKQADALRRDAEAKAKTMLAEARAEAARQVAAIEHDTRKKTLELRARAGEFADALEAKENILATRNAEKLKENARTKVGEAVHACAERIGQEWPL